MSFSTASSILRGKWLIEPAYAMAQLPIIAQLLQGKITNQQFYAKSGYAGSSPESRLPKRMYTLSSQSNLFAVSPWTSEQRIPYNSIAMVDVIGPVLKYGDYCMYGSVDYNDMMIRLANTDRVKGIIMNIDGPGGEASGTAQFAQTIREVSKVKPVLGIIQDGMAASASYWIASAVQELYVTQATDCVGSIGAYTTLYDLRGYFEEMGIKVLEIYAPQSVDKNKDYKDALEGDDTLIKSDLKFLVDDFIKAVKTNRGARLNTSTENPFTGKMYNAADAKKVGLIDGIKSMADVVKRTEQLMALRA